MTKNEKWKGWSQPIHYGINHENCPECGSNGIIRESRCETCRGCGWSTC